MKKDTFDAALARGQLENNARRTKATSRGTFQHAGRTIHVTGCIGAWYWAVPTSGEDARMYSLPVSFPNVGAAVEDAERAIDTYNQQRSRSHK